jgi:hypothetical protein
VAILHAKTLFMNSFIKGIASAFALAAVSTVGYGQTSTLIAGWDFQTTSGGGTAAAASPSTPTSFVSNVGTGNLYLDGTNGSSSWSQSTELTSFGGTSSVNANKPDGTTAGFGTANSGATSLVPLGGTSNSANGKSMVFKVSTTGFANVRIYYAAQRTGTGFTTHTWEYSTDGVNFSAYTAYTLTATSFTQVSLPNNTAAGSATNAYFRLTLTGATSGSGNNRIDNVQILGNNNSPVPVSILSFGAQAKGNTTVLNWKVANEQLLRGYSIERSVDGAEFSKIGEVAASNNNAYSFVDNQPAPVGYYRLVAQDLDGTVSYSQTLKVSADSKGDRLDLQVSPNPVTNSFKLQHEAATEGARVVVATTDGRVVSSHVVTVGATSTEVSAAELPAGLYLATFENAGTVQSVQFVK